MFEVETRGSWREMGRQMGEQTRHIIPEMMQQMMPGLQDQVPKFAGQLAALRETLHQHAPELIDETEGMAEGANLEPTLVFTLRFALHLRRTALLQQGCSLVFMAETDRGPLLARNGDMAPEVPKIQMRQIRRPVDGPQTIQTLYFAQFAGHGMNEYGLAHVGASAHAAASGSGGGRRPPAVVSHLVLHRCRNVNEAEELLTRFKLSGKGNNTLVADVEGRSTLFECVNGRAALATPRRADRSWQVCTNFYPSGRIAIKPDQQYLQSAYARYGRLMHQFDEGLVPHTLDGLKRLMGDVAKNGMCCDGGQRNTVTGYSQIFELKKNIMHLCVGSPAVNQYQAISLEDATVTQRA